MKLFEMFDAATPGYQDTASDNSAPRWKESRKFVTMKRNNILKKYTNNMALLHKQNNQQFN